MALHGIRRTTLVCLGVGLSLGCNEQKLQQGFQQDNVAPTVTIQKTAGDTLQLSGGIQFAVQATDNLGLKDLSITLTAGFAAQIDTTFTSAVTDITVGVDIPLPANSTAGGVIVIDASVTDGNDNTTMVTDSVFLVNAQALTVRILDPQAGAITAPGLQIPINIQAAQATGIARVGYTTTGVVTAADSASFTLPDTALFATTLVVPQNTSSGTFTIEGFAVDSSGRRATSSLITVNVQQVVQDNVPPFVTFTVPKRAEVSDSITVSATDPSGVTSIEWFARDLSGTQLSTGTTTSGGQLTQLTQTYGLNFNFTTFPQLVEITAFGTDANGNRGEARVDTAATSPIFRDTITVVNGITKSLPAGGAVADAIFNPNQNEFLLTNVQLNRLEVFRLADTSYVAGGIRVGSEPFGIAMWPRDTLGNYGDTVVVANSGGTNLSIVDVSPAGRRERRRHRLPNFLLQKVTTELNSTGTIVIKFTEYDFSDRPKHLGTTCRTGGGTTCAADSIYAVYSTAPTPGQTPPFENASTVRWENLTDPTPRSHFFWEHAAVLPSPDADSIRIFVDRGPTMPFDTVLSLAKGVTVNLNALGFQEETFVRSSGNATHALVGEGGDISLARAIGYMGNQALVRTVDTTTIVTTVTTTFIGPSEVDLGVTPGIRVRDQIANVASPIRSIAINFNGLTNLVRADSVYVMDENLRLAGLVPVGGANPGMDLNFQHAFDPFVGGTPGTFGGVADSSLRMVFLAREDANIDVFDTFFFKRVTTIPIRDPIIGPLRVALIPGPTQEQVLVGVTAKGVVIVRFPQIQNLFPDPIGDPTVPEEDDGA